MRSFELALAILAAPAISFPAFWSDSAPPNYSGVWELDAARSQAPAGETITYNIQDSSGKVTFTRVIHERDGKEITSHFSCATGGGQCEFDEGGRKAKVSLWYDGPSLVVLKTDGPREDAVTQWKLTMGPQGKTLNVNLEHLEPVDKSEKLVFDKKS